MLPEVEALFVVQFPEFFNFKTLHHQFTAFMTLLTVKQWLQSWAIWVMFSLFTSQEPGFFDVAMSRWLLTAGRYSVLFLWFKLYTITSISKLLSYLLLYILLFYATDKSWIGQVNDYPIMHYFGIHRHIQSYSDSIK